MDIVKQQSAVRACKIEYYGQMLVLVRFSKTCSSRNVGKRIPKIVKLPNFLDLIGYKMI